MNKYQNTMPHPVDETLSHFSDYNSGEKCCNVGWVTNAEKATLWMNKWRRAEVTSRNFCFYCYATVSQTNDRFLPTLRSKWTTPACFEAEIQQTIGPWHFFCLPVYLVICCSIAFHLNFRVKTFLMFHIKHQDRVKYLKSKKTNVLFVFFCNHNEKSLNCLKCVSFCRLRLVSDFDCCCSELWLKRETKPSKKKTK